MKPCFSCFLWVFLYCFIVPLPAYPAQGDPECPNPPCTTMEDRTFKEDRRLEDRTRIPEVKEDRPSPDSSKQRRQEKQLERPKQETPVERRDAPVKR